MFYGLLSYNWINLVEFWEGFEIIFLKNCNEIKMFVYKCFSLYVIYFLVNIFIRGLIDKCVDF